MRTTDAAEVRRKLRREVCCVFMLCVYTPIIRVNQSLERDWQNHARYLLDSHTVTKMWKLSVSIRSHTAQSGSAR
jgi:hypothetical protein